MKEGRPSDLTDATEETTANFSGPKEGPPLTAVLRVTAGSPAQDPFELHEHGFAIWF